MSCSVFMHTCTFWCFCHDFIVPWQVYEFASWHMLFACATQGRAGTMPHICALSIYRRTARQHCAERTPDILCAATHTIRASDTGNYWKLKDVVWKLSENYRVIVGTYKNTFGNGRKLYGRYRAIIGNSMNTFGQFCKYRKAIGNYMEILRKL